MPLAGYCCRPRSRSTPSLGLPSPPPSRRRLGTPLGLRARARTADRLLAEMGWIVIRIWDFEVEKDPAGCVERIVQAVAERRSFTASASWLPTAAASSGGTEFPSCRN